jgi:hypothetical protein
MKLSTIKNFLTSDAMRYVMKVALTEPAVLMILFQTIRYSILMPDKRKWVRELFERIFLSSTKTIMSYTNTVLNY